MLDYLIKAEIKMFEQAFENTHKICGIIESLSKEIEYFNFQLLN